MEDCRTLARFYNRLMVQQQAQNNARLKCMKKQIELMREREYAQFSRVHECFCNALQSIAGLNNIAINFPVDGISTLPLLYKLEARNAELKGDLDYCVAENKKLSSVIDALLGCRVVCAADVQNIMDVAYMYGGGEERIEYLSSMTSAHYQDIIQRLQNRLVKCENDNMLLSRHYIVAEKKRSELEVEHIKQNQQIDELKKQLIGVRGAVEMQVGRVNALLDGERHARTELQQNNRLLSDKLMRQIEETSIVRNDLNEFLGNQSTKIGVMIKIAMKQRDGEYARICADYKTYADECKELVSVQDVAMMQKEDLLVELRLKLIELFNKRDFHKEQFREQFEAEFLPRIGRLQDENNKLRESLSSGEDECLRLLERIDFLEEIKKTLVASNISLQKMKEQYEEQSKHISEQFVNESLTTELVQRKLTEALAEVRDQAEDRDALLKQNDTLTSNYAYAVQQYGNIIKAYQVMIVDMAQRTGKEQKEAVRLANSVQGMAYELIGSPLAKEVESGLQEVVLVGSSAIQANAALQSAQTTLEQRRLQYCASTHSLMPMSSRESYEQLENSIGTAELEASVEQCNREENETCSRSAVSAGASSGTFRRYRQCCAPNQLFLSCASQPSLAEPVKLARNEQSIILEMGSDRIETYRLDQADETEEREFYRYCSIYDEVTADAIEGAPRRAQQTSSAFDEEMARIEASVAELALPVEDFGVEVDELQISLLPVQMGTGENAELIPEYLIKKATLMYCPEYYERMFDDPEFRNLPFASQMDLLRHSNPSMIKSETSDSGTQMDSVLHRCHTFSAIPRNSYSKVCVTELPNASRAIESAGEQATLHTLRELVDMEYIEKNDEIVIAQLGIGSAVFEQSKDAQTQTVDTPSPIEMQFQTIEANEVLNAPVLTTEAERLEKIEQIIEIRERDQSTEFDDLTAELQEARAEVLFNAQRGDRFETEAKMLEFDLRERLKELYYLRVRNAELQEYQREHIRAREEHETVLCAAPTPNETYAHVYNQFAKRYSGYEQSFAKFLYLAEVVEEHAASVCSDELVAKISAFDRRIVALDETVQETLRLARERNEQVQSLLQVLRQYAQRGDTKMQVVLENSGVARALLALYKDDEEIIKNAFLQRTFQSETATETNPVQRASSPHRTNSPCTRQEHKYSETNETLATRKSAPCTLSSALIRSKSVQVSVGEQRVAAKNAQIRRLMDDIKAKSRQLQQQGHEIQNERLASATLLRQMQELNHYFNENPRDIDQQQLADLTEVVLLQQQHIICLTNNVARLQHEQGQAEKAMQFMFGEVEYTSKFDGCLFKTSTMRNVTNLDFAATQNAEK